MELRVVLPAGAVLEHRHRDIGRQDLDMSLLVPDPRIGAVAEHGLFQRHPGRVVVRLLDLTTQLGIGDGPERGYALVSRECHVDARRALIAARVPGEFLGAVRCKAVIEPVEVAAVDLAAVLEAEQALGVEPHPVGLLSRRVVLVGMTERALALQVVGRRRRLGEGGYHCAVSGIGRTGATAFARHAAAPGANVGTLMVLRSSHNVSCHPLDTDRIIVHASRQLAL